MIRQIIRVRDRLPPSGADLYSGAVPPACAAMLLNLQ